MVKKFLFLLALLLTQYVYAEKISLLLDWYINPNHAPVLLAISNGDFNKYGLDIELIEPSDNTDSAKLVALKKVDLAITYQPHYQQQTKQHLPIQQIGTLIKSPLDCLVYLPSSGIHSAKDLKGKRIGYSDASDEFQLLKAVLKSANLTVDDVTLINVHYSLTQALMMKKIDLAIGMMRNVEPVVLQEHGFKPQMLYPENFGISPYSELIFIGSSGEKTSADTAFLKALQDSTLYLKQRPDEAWNIVIKQYPQLNTKTNYAIWQQTIPLFYSDSQVIS